MQIFDTWREHYQDWTMEQQVAFHNDLEAQYPEQAHFNYQAFEVALALAKLVNTQPWILEYGTWKGDLAQRAFNDHYWLGSWTGIEICTAAVAKTKCVDPRFSYVVPDRFDWFTRVREYPADLVVATHFIEHLSADHLGELIIYTQGAPVVLFEAPLAEEGQDWTGYQGTHKLPLGWRQVTRLMELAGYALKHQDGDARVFTFSL